MSDIIAIAPGGMYYPEMGERADGTALFEMSHSRNGYYVKWLAARHEDALAAFKANRIKPRNMDKFITIHGVEKYSCGVTWAAGDKIKFTPAAIICQLLD